MLRKLELTFQGLAQCLICDKRVTATNMYKVQGKILSLLTSFFL